MRSAGMTLGLAMAGAIAAALFSQPAEAGMGCQLDLHGASCFVSREPGVSAACRTPHRDACELVLLDQDPQRFAAGLHLVTVTLRDSERDSNATAAFVLLAERLEGRPDAVRVIGDLGILVGLRVTEAGIRLRLCHYTLGEPASFAGTALDARPGAELRVPVVVSEREMLLVLRYEQVGLERFDAVPGGLALTAWERSEGRSSLPPLSFAQEEQHAPVSCPP